jgi:DNA sulfur modification protein DndD
LDIEDAERGVEHLTTVANNLRRQFQRRETGEVMRIQEEIDGLEKAITELHRQLDEKGNGLKPRLEQCRIERRLVEAELYKYQDIHQLLEDEKRLEQGVQANTEVLNNTRRELRKYSSEFYVPIGYDVIERALKILEDKRRKGELPKHIKRSFVQERLDMGKCICGADLAVGTPARLEVEAFGQTLSDTLSDIAQEMNGALSAMKERGSHILAQIRGEVKRFTGALAHRAELEDALKAARAKIQAREDIPDVPALQTKKQHLENEEEDLIKRIAGLENEINENKKISQDKNTMLAALMVRQQKLDVVERKWILANRALETLEGVIASFRAKARTYLEEQCNKVGKQLFWREDIYRIHISDDYFVTVSSKNYGDKDLLAGMSMGITQMTGLALIAALAQQTRADAPLIMDTPFARLGPAHITRALAECPRYFTQWFLFLQPSEWRDEEYRRVLGAAIQKEFTLRRDNMTGVTFAEDGYQPKYFGKVKVS